MSEEKKPETSPEQDKRPAKTTDRKGNAAPSADQPVDALRQPKPATPGASNKVGSDKKKTSRAVPSRAIAVGALLVVVIGGLSTMVWWQHQRFEGVAREVADRLQKNDESMTLIEKQASQALSLARSQSKTLEQTTQRLSRVSHDLASLEQDWQSTTMGLDQKLLVNDFRRLLTMANQQLTLMGNVSSAISILESLRTMLQAQETPSLDGLTQAVNTDLARLREVPLVDPAAISMQLDSLIALSDKAPLLVPDRVQPTINEPHAEPAAAPDKEESDLAKTATPETSSDLTWWQQLPDQAQALAGQASRVVVDEFAAMVSVRRANDPQALLLSEEQAMALRSNVRSMLLSAQLALLTRQSDIWRSELSEVASLLNTRYDTESLDTKAALQLTEELLATPISVSLPTLTDSLSALELVDRSISTPATPEVN